MKGLMYLSISILCLSVSALIGFHLGVTTARADYEPGGFVVGLDGDYILTADGHRWVATVGGAQNFAEDNFGPALPPELSNPIKFWSRRVVVTETDEVYSLDGTGPHWFYLGVRPGSAVQTESTT